MANVHRIASPGRIELESGAGEITAGDYQAGNYTKVDGDGDITQAGTARIDWTLKTPASVTLTKGSSANVVADLQTAFDGSFYHVDEAADTPGIDLAVNFTGVTAFNWVSILAVYAGSASHAVAIQLYNWTDVRYDTFNALQTGKEDVSTASGYILGNYSFLVPSDTKYIGTGGDAGKVTVRFYHTMLGNASHDLYIDVCNLAQ